VPAPTTLTTLDAIKDRLRIPSDQHDQDEIIDAMREGVEEDILSLTGFTFASGQQVDTLTDWQRGQTRLMRFRPVKSLDLIEGRVLGTTATFNTLLGDVKNATDSRILLVGYLNAFYDPRAGYGAAAGGGTWENWFKWREYTWPIVRVKYTVDELGSGTNPIPKALTRAAVEWTAFIMSKPVGSGAITNVSIEKVSESYGPGTKGAMPSIVQAWLARYMRDLISFQV
jgi:hypothetical protein